MAPDHEKKFNELLTYLKDAKTNSLLILDSKGTILEFNQAFTNHFGYLKEDLQGKNFEILFTPEDRQKKKPCKEIESVLMTGRGADNNYLVAKNNQFLWVSGESVLVKTKSGERYILKLVQNIHTHKIAELNYLELNEFNESILATIDDAVIVFDRKKKLFRYNDSFEALLKPIKKPFTYDKLVQFLGSFDRDGQIVQKIKQTKKTGNCFKNIQITVPDPIDGNKVYMVNGYKLAQSDQEDRILIMLQNITPLKNLENEREDIMAFVAHELRAPLTNLTLCNELIENYLAAQQTEKAKMILSNVKNNLLRLNRMVAELNASSRIHGGNIPLEKTRFNFTETLKEICATMRALHPEFVINCIKNEPLIITADKFRLIEVITNYLSNAVKYSSGNKKVIVNSTIKNKNLIFSVKDHGKGISKEELPFMFSRYFRAEKTKYLEGIGLGLYLCEKIITAHGGKVWVESELGKGSEFYFSIPVGKTGN